MLISMEFNEWKNKFANSDISERKRLAQADFLLNYEFNRDTISQLHLICSNEKIRGVRWRIYKTISEINSKHSVNYLLNQFERENSIKLKLKLLRYLVKFDVPSVKTAIQRFQQHESIKVRNLALQLLNIGEKKPITPREEKIISYKGVALQ